MNEGASKHNPVEVAKAMIGQHIRLLRLQQNRTIAEIARECSFSKSLLSKIENGRVVPSVGTLVKIASALGTSVSALVESSDDKKTVFTLNETSHKSMIRTEKGLYLYPFAAEHKDNKMQPFLYVLRRGEVKPQIDSHQGQEFIFVLKGVLKFRVGPVEYILEEGDSIYFNSIERHVGTPVSDVVEYLDIFA